MMNNDKDYPWYEDVEPGWYYIVKPLIDYANSAGLVIGQVKEKFGGLRFYMDKSDERMDHMITLAEYCADLTCEICGLPGAARNLPWIKTLCDEHYQAKVKEWDERQAEYDAKYNKKG